MRREDARIKAVLADLMAQLDASDPRLVAFQQSSGDEDVSLFAASLLGDRSLAPTIVRRALWLVPLFPTPSLLAQVITTMQERPALAVIAGLELGELKDPSTISALEQLLLNPNHAPESRAGAASALAKIRDPQVKPSLVRILRTPGEHPVVLAGVAGTLGIIQLMEQSTDAADDLSNLLKSDSPDVRFAALNALANMGAAQALDEVEALLGDTAVTSSGERLCDRAAQVSKLLQVR